MNLFALSWTQVASLALLIAPALFRALRRRERDWRVAVKPGEQWVRTDDYRWHDKINVNDSVHVRLVGPGSDVLIASVKIAADGYDDALNDAIAKARERATVLNAMAATV